MLSIKVLGPGCANCQRVAQMVMATLGELETELGDKCPEATLQKITDHGEFLNYGVMVTPGLVINEKLACTGRIPTKAEVRQWLTSALAEADT
jgi:small redox-active disulfide protein 2